MMKQEKLFVFYPAIMRLAKNVSLFIQTGMGLK